MDKSSKLNERLTLIANLSVVVGIIFLAVELRQNTQAIQAQTRDSLTEKQMLLTEWFNNPESAALITKVQSLGVGELDEVELNWWTILAAGTSESGKTRTTNTSAVSSLERTLSHVWGVGGVLWPAQLGDLDGTSCGKASPPASEPKSTASWQRWMARREPIREGLTWTAASVAVARVVSSAPHRSSSPAASFRRCTDGARAGRI